jgi:hypothetical protein
VGLDGDWIRSHDEGWGTKGIGGEGGGGNKYFQSCRGSFTDAGMCWASSLRLCDPFLVFLTYVHVYIYIYIYISPYIYGNREFGNQGYPPLYIPVPPNVALGDQQL